MKQLLLLGGGHAHVHVLKALAAEPLAGAEVTLVSPHLRQMYSGMVPGLVAGHYRVDDCVIPLAPLAAAAGVRFIEGAAAAVHAGERRVSLATGESLPYDVLSVDTGPVMDRDAISGAREHALFVRPIEQFVQQWEDLVEQAPARPFHIAVIGGGAAGVELAMALQHRLAARARVSLITGGARPLPSHSAGVQARALKALGRLGVSVVEDTCTEVAASQVRLGRGTSLACDAAVAALGTSAPVWLANSGLALDALGFIATGPTLQSASHAEVFAAGDVASRLDAPHPRSGVYAVRAGPPLALNLRRFIEGGALSPYTPQQRSLNLLACGGRYAIASWGPWSVEGRWVWRWKDRIDRAFTARYGGQTGG